MRTHKDIHIIRVLTKVQGVNGWVVDIAYTDDKSVTFAIDYGKPDFDMLAETFRSIKLQMESKQDGK